MNWKVMAWDRDGRESPWSDLATFSLGLLGMGDWKGQWISIRDEAPLHADRTTLHLPPARHYRKPFATAKPVKRAVLHGTALGIVDWSIDGRRVSEDLFQPGWADYHRRVHARTHDVTALLATPGPWVGAFDLPFGLPREMVQDLAWPTHWPELVRHCAALGKAGFTAAIDHYRAGRALVADILEGKE